MDLTSDEAVQAELDTLVDLGVLEYVIPTVPVGERWVLGLRGEIQNLDGTQVRCFLLGAHAVTWRMCEQQGISIMAADHVRT